MADNLKVMIIDDDEAITNLLDVLLTGEGFQTSIALDGETALLKFDKEHPNLVISDLNLPGLNGIEVCRRIRSKSQVPIIIITGIPQYDVEVCCMDIGADDYFTKPFNSQKLMSHIKAVLRRTIGYATKTEFSSGVIKIDIKARTVMIDNKQIHLTPKEFDVLVELAINKGRVVSYNDLLIKIWGENYKDSVKYVQDCIRSLRQKIEAIPSDPKYIINVLGTGYRFCV